MTIRACKAISRQSMERFIASSVGDRTDPNRSCAQRYDHVWVISISDPGRNQRDLFPEGEPDKIENHGVAGSLCLSFHDAQPYDDLTEKDMEDRGYQLITNDQATKIVEFVARANRGLTDQSNDLLLVNCMMGIARSGAIVTFAMEMSDGFVERDQFAKMNPQIHPNLYILKKLYSADRALRPSRYRDR